jgi:hypothetical protein
MEAQERAAVEAEAVALGTQVQQLTTAARWAASVLPELRISSQQGGSAPEGVEIQQRVHTTSRRASAAHTRSPRCRATKSRHTMERHRAEGGFSASTTGSPPRHTLRTPTRTSKWVVGWGVGSASARAETQGAVQGALPRHGGATHEPGRGLHCSVRVLAN